jgi:2-oxoglutarate/2-oxoacid ferredoxin oxidoreductase subunit beta
MTQTPDCSFAAPPCKPADYASDQEVRWCPGCGNYAILAQVRKVLAELGVRRSHTVFVSGIGCSSRFPYYMNTYGFHTIHGRAPTVATGLKIARPDLDVWVVTGDGDALSIGGNHFLHVFRRNVNLKILLFNNRIYGLTKGQYSPTSERGAKTKSSPQGSLEAPIRPLSVALACGATFVARTVSVDLKHLEYVLKRAAQHKGTALVEIYQNCQIFNDGIFEYATDKSLKPDHTLYLEHGKPLLFGKDADQSIRLRDLQPEVFTVGQDNASQALIHDEREARPVLSFIESMLMQPEFPEPFGVFRAVEQESFEATVHEQIRQVRAQHGPLDLQGLLNGSETWTVN